MAPRETTSPATAAARPCPVCGKRFVPDEEHPSFCSDRCRTIDLGRWLDERYVISRPAEQRDLEEGVE